MIDIERLAKAWEIFRDSNPYEICDGREFMAIKEPEYCMGQMIEDTITILKEQEPVKPTYEDFFGTRIARCGNCNVYIVRYRYCPGCGKQVKWNDD